MLAFDANLDPPIVSVQIFAFFADHGQLVGSGKMIENF
jgi:hypothetical protein